MAQERQLVRVTLSTPEGELIETLAWADDPLLSTHQRLLVQQGFAIRNAVFCSENPGNLPSLAQVVDATQPPPTSRPTPPPAARPAPQPQPVSRPAAPPTIRPAPQPQPVSRPAAPPTARPAPQPQPVSRPAAPPAARPAPQPQPVSRPAAPPAAHPAPPVAPASQAPHPTHGEPGQPAATAPLAIGSKGPKEGGRHAGKASGDVSAWYSPLVLMTFFLGGNKGFIQRFSTIAGHKNFFEPVLLFFLTFFGIILHALAGARDPLVATAMEWSPLGVTIHLMPASFGYTWATLGDSLVILAALTLVFHGITMVKSSPPPITQTFLLIGFARFYFILATVMVSYLLPFANGFSLVLGFAVLGLFLSLRLASVVSHYEGYGNAGITVALFLVLLVTAVAFQSSDENRPSFSQGLGLPQGAGIMDRYQATMKLMAGPQAHAMISRAMGVARNQRYRGEMRQAAKDLQAIGAKYRKENPETGNAQMTVLLEAVGSEDFETGLKSFDQMMAMADRGIDPADVDSMPEELKSMSMRYRALLNRAQEGSAAQAGDGMDDFEGMAKGAAAANQGEKQALNSQQQEIAALPLEFSVEEKVLASDGVTPVLLSAVVGPREKLRAPFWVHYDLDYRGDRFQRDVSAFRSTVMEYLPAGPGRFQLGVQASDNGGHVSDVEVIDLAVGEEAVLKQFLGQGPFVEGLAGVLRPMPLFVKDLKGPLSWEWDVDYDGATFSPDFYNGAERMLHHRFDRSGKIRVAYRVKDAQGALLAQKDLTITVANAAPMAVIGLADTAADPSAVTLEARCTDPSPKDRIVKLEWDLDYDGKTFTPDLSGEDRYQVKVKRRPGQHFVVAMRCTDNDAGISAVTTYTVTAPTGQ